MAIINTNEEVLKSLRYRNTNDIIPEDINFAKYYLPNGIVNGTVDEISFVLTEILHDIIIGLRKTDQVEVANFFKNILPQDFTIKWIDEELDPGFGLYLLYYKNSLYYQHVINTSRPKVNSDNKINNSLASAVIYILYQGLCADNNFDPLFLR